jgi:hypothetical protein
MGLLGMWMIIAAIAVAGTLSSFTDWLFMGVLFHASYNTYPEVWWPGIREGQNRRGIIWATVLGYVMTAGVVLLCVVSGANTIAKGLEIALLAWLAGPPVVIIVNGFFIKMDPKITLAHCVGYGARLLLAGVAGAVAVGGV